MPNEPFTSDKSGGGVFPQTSSPKASLSSLLPSPGGHVVFAASEDKTLDYDTLHYAPARSGGDVLYVSGVIIERLQGEANDTPAFKDQIRRGFRKLAATLRAAGASFADVTMMNSFHVWDSPNYRGTKAEHFGAFASVKDEFLVGPYPCWTAIGTTGLVTDGMIEIQLIVHLPNATEHAYKS